MTAPLKSGNVLPTGPLTLNMTDHPIIRHCPETTESKVIKMATYEITHGVFSHKTGKLPTLNQCSDENLLQNFMCFYDFTICIA